jgi:DNA-binding beta-propeller fold protein YncE
MLLSDLLAGALVPGATAIVAGSPYREGVAARAADAGWPMGVVRRPDGDLVVVDYQAHMLWRIDREGILHRFAGDGFPGRRGDGGPAREARFFHPHDLCQDRQGNLYLSDLGNRTIRRIDYRTGVVTRVAGSGAAGRGGDGGPALEAELDCTCGVAVDHAGNLYLSDEWACTIRRVDASTGIITRFAGQDARHYPSERGPSRPLAGPGLSLMGYHGDGGPAAEAAFHHPEHLAFDSRGDLYVCDNSNDRVRKIDLRTGIITTVFGNGTRSSSGDGGPAVEAGTLMPDAICLDAHDNLYVGEKYGFRVRKVEAATGLARTLVGDGVPGFGAEGRPGAETRCNSCEAGIWADPDGTVLWGDCSGRLRRYDGGTSIVTTALGGTGVGDGGAAIGAFLCGPGGLATGPDGRLYIADVWSQRVRAVDARTGAISTVAGNGARAYGGDGGPATEAYLGNPHDVSVDTRGRLVIADTRHGHVRRVDEQGAITTVAGTGLQWDKGDGGPALGACVVHVEAVAHGPGDDIFLGDAVGRIRRIDARTGIISTVAGIGIAGYSGDGGAATRARIGAPTAIRFDRAGNLYFTDRACHVVRRVDAQSGLITTVAGVGRPGFSPDGTAAHQAMLDTPWGLELGPDGAIYVADSRNNCVRCLRPGGPLKTIVGGDERIGGLPLNEPHGLRLYGAGVLLVSDHFNNRVLAVRMTSPRC